MKAWIPLIVYETYCVLLALLLLVSGIGTYP